MMKIQALYQTHAPKLECLNLRLTVIMSDSY